MRGDDDDTSGGAVTQGGHRDETEPGPARRSGGSFLWFAAALLVAGVLAVALLSVASRKNAPGEANTVTMSRTPGAEAGRAGAQSPGS